LDRKQRRKDD
jgi:hypothetical protein